MKEWEESLYIKNIARNIEYWEDLKTISREADWYIQDEDFISIRHTEVDPLDVMQNYRRRKAG